mmetsp:Transcript_3023/g.7104  ORF Transcript_3023/g.7104 Transcript_3023/m.7104 type:complete len:131 (+) Transcript_3023:866-1258(+)
MTIKGPNAHNYNGGLGDLLGWGQGSRYDYSDDYDVEAHRRYLYEQQLQQQQHQQQYQPEPDSGFSNALSNPSPQGYSVPTNTQVQMGGGDDAAAEAARKQARTEKLKKQAANIVGFIVILLIWLASGAIQ